MTGYYFVAAVYESGRVVLNATRYATQARQERAAARLKRKPNVKRVIKGYQPSMSDVDIKKFI